MSCFNHSLLLLLLFYDLLLSGLVVYQITPKLVMEFGNPKEAICDAVEKLRVDLLIVGSHGRGALQRCVDQKFQCILTT